jgi:hypothetical protein
MQLMDLYSPRYKPSVPETIIDGFEINVKRIKT